MWEKFKRSGLVRSDGTFANDTQTSQIDDGAARYSKSATSQEWKDNDGNTFKTQPTTLSKLTQYTGITNGLKHLQKAGLISTAQNIEIDIASLHDRSGVLVIGQG
jgi:hypothetical protein